MTLENAPCLEAMNQSTELLMRDWLDNFKFFFDNGNKLGLSSSSNCLRVVSGRRDREVLFLLHRLLHVLHGEKALMVVHGRHKSRL